MSSANKTLEPPHKQPAEPVTITITETGCSIRFNDPNPETRFRPLSNEEVDRAIEKAEHQSTGK